MSRRRKIIPFLSLLSLALACPKKDTAEETSDARAAPVREGPIRVENVVGLELNLPAPWSVSALEPEDKSNGVLFRARRTLAKAGLKVPPSLVVERGSVDEAEAAVGQALRALEALEAKAGIELEKTASGLRSLAGRNFRAVEASYRVGPAGGSSVRLVQRSFFLEVPDAPPGARILGFHFTHLAEDAEALGTELDVVLSGLELTGPRLAIPGQPGSAESGAGKEEQ